MTVLSKTPPLPGKMTADEFLVWAETQEGRWELHKGVPVRKHDPAKGQSERIRHIRVKNAVVRALGAAIAHSGRDCEALADGATVRLEDETTYEPDAVVYCGERLGNDEIVVPEPLIIVEVLSPSTAYKDVGDKLLDYFRLPSLAHYLVVDPLSVHIAHYHRAGHDIVTKIFRAGELRLDPPGLLIDVASLFAPLQAD